MQIPLIKKFPGGSGNFSVYQKKNIDYTTVFKDMFKKNNFVYDRKFLKIKDVNSYYNNEI